MIAFEWPCRYTKASEMTGAQNLRKVSTGFHTYCIPRYSEHRISFGPAKFYSSPDARVIHSRLTGLQTKGLNGQRYSLDLCGS